MKEKIDNSQSRNILIVTSIYPGPNIPNSFTPIVHYFVKEWAKNPLLRLKVIHTPAYFPSLLYLIPKSIKNIVSTRLGFSLPQEKLSKPVNFILEGISVSRVPMFKFIPMGNFSKKEIERKSETIIKILEDENFIPDIIISHWFNPQIFLLSYLKHHYNCKTVLTLHENADKFKSNKDINLYIQNVDSWGYRNTSIKNGFLKNYGIEPTIHCCSGIPNQFIFNPPERSFETISKFIFIGGLLKRKHPDKVIKALKESFSEGDYTLNIVGEGPERKNLQSLISKLDCKENVSLIGRIPRVEILDFLDASDVFVMISNNEAFGLVYIEAMARGCIVIASKNEGMEGIIKDGYNGFLCEAGDEQDLKRIISRIRSMAPSELNKVSKNAYRTAKEMTDSKVAERYLYDINNS